MEEIYNTVYEDNEGNQVFLYNVEDKIWSFEKNEKITKNLIDNTIRNLNNYYIKMYSKNGWIFENTDRHKITMRQSEDCNIISIQYYLKFSRTKLARALYEDINKEIHRFPI